MKFCSNCGADPDHRIPSGEDRLRYVCDTCDNIHYENPKMVVGTVPLMIIPQALCFIKPMEPAAPFRFGR